MQNFRDRERAAVNDIVVYTEFGPGVDTATAEPISPNTTTNEPDNKFGMMNVDECDASQIVTTTTILSTNEKTEHNVEEMNSDNSTQLQQQPLSPTKTNNNSSATHPHVDVESSPTATPPTSDVQRIEIEKLTISPSESKKSSSTKNNHQKDESSEKIVKIQNQKNKESFLPKFFLPTSNKDKDKDKDKEKVKDEPEVKTKKKSLIFFRRSKSTTSSPTHAPANNATADKNEDDNWKGKPERNTSGSGVSLLFFSRMNDTDIIVHKLVEKKETWNF